MALKAKCGIHSLSFCNNKHDATQCTNCILVKHRDAKLYIYNNGQKLKRCPHCEQYKSMYEFKQNSKGHRSWCNDCHRQYALARYYTDNKTYIVGYKENNKKIFKQFDSTPKMLKYIKHLLVDENSTHIEIKTIKINKK